MAKHTSKPTNIGGQDCGLWERRERKREHDSSLIALEPLSEIIYRHLLRVQLQIGFSLLLHSLHSAELRSFQKAGGGPMHSTL